MDHSGPLPLLFHHLDERHQNGRHLGAGSGAAGGKGLGATPETSPAPTAQLMASTAQAETSSPSANCFRSPAAPVASPR